MTSTYALLTALPRPGLAVLDLSRPVAEDRLDYGTELFAGELRTDPAYGVDLDSASHLLAAHGWDIDGPWTRSDACWVAPVVRAGEPRTPHFFLDGDRITYRGQTATVVASNISDDDVWLPQVGPFVTIAYDTPRGRTKTEVVFAAEITPLLTA